MAQVWLPWDSDFALAFREPNLLVPGIKPTGNISADRINKRLGIQGVWGFDGPSGKTDGSIYGLGANRLADVFGRNNLHGYFTDGSNEAEYGTCPFGRGLFFDGNDSQNRTAYNDSDVAPLTGGTTFFVVAFVNDVSKKTALIGNYNGGLTPLRRYGQGIHIESNTIYASRSINNSTQFASQSVSAGLVVAAARLGSGALAVNGALTTGTMGSTSQSYHLGLGQSGWQNSNLAILDGVVLVGGYADRDWSDGELLAFTQDPFRSILDSDVVPYLISVPAGGGAPTLSDISAESITSTSVTPRITVTGSSSGGTLYWAVYPSAQGDPTASEIINETVSNGIFGSDTSPVVTEVDFDGTEITGLTAGTSYKLAAVWDDGSDTSDVVVSGAWSTLAASVGAAGAKHSHTADIAALGNPSQAMGAAGAKHSHTADIAALGNPSQAMGAAGAKHSHTADIAAVTLPGKIDLGAESARHAHKAGVAALGRPLVFMGAAGAKHSHTADTAAVISASELLAASAKHAHTADTAPLGRPKIQLGAAGAKHAHKADAATFVVGFVLAAAAAKHVHKSDTVTIGRVKHALFALSAAHRHTADTAAITAKLQLGAASAKHSHTADIAQTAISGTTLGAASAKHTHTADTAILSNVRQTLPGASARHRHTAEFVAYWSSAPPFVPTLDRTYFPAVDLRTYAPEP